MPTDHSAFIPLCTTRCLLYIRAYYTSFTDAYFMSLYFNRQFGPGALGRPSGTGWRGWWVGGSGWGTHVYPRLIRVNVWQKPLQYCKVISLQLIKIKNKTKQIFCSHSSKYSSSRNSLKIMIISSMFLNILNWSLVLSAHLIINVIVCVYVCAHVLNYFSHFRLFATPWTVAHQALLSMRFFRQEYWSGLPLPSPGDLLNPGTEAATPDQQASSCIAGRFFTLWATREIPIFSQLLQCSEDLKPSGQLGRSQV